jgi:hypothetical protein
MRTETIAKFTKIENGWVDGRLTEKILHNGRINDTSLVFQAKVFQEGSSYGIDECQTVSKLSIWNENKGWWDGLVVNYDRGWDVEPTYTNRHIYEAVLKVLRGVKV